MTLFLAYNLLCLATITSLIYRLKLKSRDYRPTEIEETGVGEGRLIGGVICATPQWCDYPFCDCQDLEFIVDLDTGKRLSRSEVREQLSYYSVDEEFSVNFEKGNWSDWRGCPHHLKYSSRICSLCGQKSVNLKGQRVRITGSLSAVASSEVVCYHYYWSSTVCRM